MHLLYPISGWSVFHQRVDRCGGAGHKTKGPPQSLDGDKPAASEARRLQQVQFTRAGHGLGAALRVEFAVGIVDVGLDRAGGDDELRGDFLIR